MLLITRALTRPAYIIPAMIVIAAFVMLTLTPWKMGDAVGYEVAFAGVDKNLALDEEKFSVLLAELGMPEAEFNVQNCDDQQACQIKISALRSQEDVGKVVTAMYKIGNCELLEVVNEDNVALFDHQEQYLQQMITEDVEGNIVCKFIDELSDEYQEQVNVLVDVVIQKHFNYAHQLAVACQGENDGEPRCNIWISSARLGGSQDSIIGCMPGQAICVDTLVLGLGQCDINSCVKIGEISADFKEQQLDVVNEPLSKAEVSAGVIDGFSLSQNYPNPFNASTIIEFNVPDGAQAVKLEIFNIRGQLVATLVDEVRSAGTHQIAWDATDAHGVDVGSGVYLYRLTAGDFTETKKMSLMR